MTGFFGAVGDWRHRPSEFSFDDALARLRGAGGEVPFVKVADIGTIGGQNPSADQSALGVGLKLGSQASIAEAGTVTVLFTGRASNRAALAIDLGQEGSATSATTDAAFCLRAFQRWGVDAFRRLEGSWCATVVDAATGQVLLAGDHFGSRPLFYGAIQGQLVFGTYLKSLTSFFSGRLAVDAGAVYDFLLQSTTRPERTLVKGIYRILPAQAVSLKLRNLASIAMLNDADSVNYWKMTVRPVEATVPLQKALLQVTDDVTEAVTQCLDTVSQPIVALSGGLHSSSVLFALRKALKGAGPLDAVSLVADQATQDRHLQRIVSETNAACRFVEPAQTRGDEIEELAGMLGDPVNRAGTLRLWSLFKRVREQGYDKIITGVGGKSYLGADVQSQSARLADYLRAGEVASGLKYAWALRKRVPLRELSASAIQQAWPLSGSPGLPLHATPDFFSEALREAEDARLGRGTLPPTVGPVGLQEQLATAFALASRFEIEHWAPLASVHLVETIDTAWARKLETSAVAQGGLFSMAMKRLMPEDLVDDCIRANALDPEIEAMTGASELIFDALHDDRLGDLPVTGQLLRESWLLMLKSQAVYDPIVWRWVSLALWAKSHRVSFG